MDCTTCPTRATCGQVCPELEAQLKKHDTPRRERFFADLGTDDNGHPLDIENEDIPQDFWAHGLDVGSLPLELLSERQRQCFELYAEIGDKTRVGERLGIGRKTVDVYLNRAVRCLRVGVRE